VDKKLLRFSRARTLDEGGNETMNFGLHIAKRLLRQQPGFSMASLPIRVLPDDLEMESQKVRSMYESGSEFDWYEGRYVTTDNRSNVDQEVAGDVLQRAT
jgi:hypothetical protein